MIRTIRLMLLLCLLLSVERVAAQEYNRDILPILSEHCFACHGFDAKARQASLRLDVAEGAIAEADSGVPAVVPFHPNESEMIRRIDSTDEDLRMPPRKTGKALSAEQREVLQKWIAAGAKYQKHWSFEQPQAITPPSVKNLEHPIDRFIQSRLQKENLAPSPPADDATLLRRVSLDLTGLPPTLQELDAFLAAVKSDREQAYRQVVERLLQSAHYGERWGRWWLDQARYADSNGYSIDAPRQIWKYRDWVISALNRDMPFDQFTIEQLAGDLLPDATQDQKVATGFHRNTQINQEGGIDKEQFRIDSVFDRVATTGTVWLGLTIGCAQCHDHKFDPIEQKEYYQFFAFFNNQDEPTLEVVDSREQPPELKQNLKQAEVALDAFIASKADDYHAWESKLTAEEIQKLSKSAQEALKLAKDKRKTKQVRELFSIEVGKIDAAYQALLQAVAELEEQVAGITTTLVMAERTTPRTTHVYIKGDFTRPAEQVTYGTPAVLHPLPERSTAANRLDLAQWIVRPENPLTARVIVNRAWQVYFGRGIVETENDFGSLGALPTHPELLDWLAVEFQKQNWSLKNLHRLIVTSHTYRQSSSDRSDLKAIDPKNYLLGRQQRLRLEAELVRDASLAACGLLSEKLAGPPVFPPIPSGVMDKGQVKRTWKASEGEDRYRRGVYTFVYRATPPPALNVFDAPDGYSTCTRRSRSNTPLQALTLLNDSSFFEFATALEKIVRNDGLQTAFRRCTSRLPNEDELALLRQLDPLSAARVMLNLDETVTRE
jgi:Protein of unknown function (DUF1549)/Protein of unknown function (DUF1553)/Planctomycete cytochrome C